MRRESWATSPATRKSMRGNKARDTKPEVAVRRLLHAAGLRYRVNAQPEPDLRRTADILFTRKRIAVFIDGCYWHGCPEHYTVPKANAAFWRGKLEANRARDADTTQSLEERGWKVLRFWTHESASDIAAAIAQETGGSVHSGYAGRRGSVRSRSRLGRGRRGEDMAAGKSSSGGRGRSAITGRFVKPSTVKSHPKTTVTESTKKTT